MEQNNINLDFKPAYLNSPVTLDQKETIAELSNMTGYDQQTVKEIFTAYAALVKNYHNQGINVALPSIGVFKIMRSFFPLCNYTKNIAAKYGTFKHPKNLREYIVLFTPRIIFSPYFRTQITDNLPNNEQAVNIKRMPFGDHHKAYNYEKDSDIDSGIEQDFPASEEII